MSIQIDISEKGDVSILKLEGSIDALSIDDLNIAFNNIRKKGNKNTLLIFKKIKYINSNAIRAILSFAKWIDHVGGELKIAEVPSNVMDIFKLMRFDELLSFYSSASDAFKSFKN